MFTTVTMATIAIIFSIVLNRHGPSSVDPDMSWRRIAVFFIMAAYLIWCLCWVVYTIIVWGTRLVGCAL